MNRNEYRRAFIMLRAALPGYGGHVRLERRTLTGSMYFIVNAPQEASAPTALLAGQRDGAYYAVRIGQLSRDRRGQLTLAYAFDPRAIDGRPLEAYAWVVVARSDGAVALTGNVDGSRPMDQAALAQAVRGLVAPEPAPAFDLPEPDEPEPRPPEEAHALQETQAEPAAEHAPAEPAVEAMEEAADDIRIYTGSRNRGAAKPAGEPDIAQAATPSEPDFTQAATPSEPDDAQDATPSEPDVARTAAQALGLDITRPWPGDAESLRRLFATQAPSEDAPEDGYTYVRAPMPEGSGYAECLVGLRAEDGAPTAIRYALPGLYSPEPPAGMEDYRWSEAGCWVLDMDVSS